MGIVISSERLDFAASKQHSANTMYLGAASISPDARADKQQSEPLVGRLALCCGNTGTPALAEPNAGHAGRTILAKPW
jgi:hypothetical protein